MIRRAAGSWLARAAAFLLVATTVAIATASLSLAAPASASTANTAPGYWVYGAAGNVHQFGTTNFGSLSGVHLNRPIVAGAATGNGLGYWLVGSDGGVFAFGNAPFYGSTGNVRLNRPIVGMAMDPATGGYWLVASDGGVFSFRAPFYGSTGNVRLNRPIVGMAPTPDGKGYWLVASDGGIFSFGDAHFYGSTGAVRLVRPVVGMAPTSDGKGYWLVASDGGIFSFGDAHFYGSTGAVRLVRPVVGMAAAAGGSGYWLVASDGGIFAFGHAPFLGSTGSNPGPDSIVGMMATPWGYPFPPGATGYDISNFQCPGTPGGPIPTVHTRVGVVQVTGVGGIDGQPNPCYKAEATWAGANMSAYIFVDKLPSPTPSQSLTGPAGTCRGNVDCESYNFGWYWARHWVAYSRSVGVDPTLWWLDVETAANWNLGASAHASNAKVIAGAVAGLKSMGVLAGIYCTAYQWGLITGSLVSFPGLPLWVPGAGNIRGGTNTATEFCAGPISLYEPFAAGSVVLVQYGYSFTGGYSGPPSKYDLDYACP